MANPSKKIGTRGETDVVRYLTGLGLPTERKALAGVKDKGDLRMLTPGGTEVTLEVKSGRQTESYGRAKLADWKRQTTQEGIASGCPAVLVIKRYRKPLCDAHVWLPRFGRWVMMYLDDFAHWALEGGFDDAETES